MEENDYLTTPLTDREAGRVKTLLLKRKGKAIVQRERFAALIGEARQIAENWK